MLEKVATIARRALLWSRADQGEDLDPTPVEIPDGYHHPPSLQEVLARFLRTGQGQSILQEHGYETMEDAEDFELGEEDRDPDDELSLWDQISPHTVIEEMPVVAEERAAETADSSPAEPTALEKAAPSDASSSSEAENLAAEPAA